MIISRANENLARHYYGKNNDADNVIDYTDLESDISYTFYGKKECHISYNGEYQYRLLDTEALRLFNNFRNSFNLNYSS